METFNNILVVSRSTKHCLKAVRTGISLARKFGAKLHVLHVIHDPFIMDGWNLSAPTFQDEYRKMIADAKKELDGWWAEAYRSEVGWAIGDGREHGEDPAWDAHEAEQLYRLLEQEVIPAFYDRGPDGIPRAWVQRMRTSMAELTPRFSTNRMVREYVERLYLPAAQAYRDRTADRAGKAVLLCRRRKTLEAHWPRLGFGDLEIQEVEGHFTFEVPVFMPGLKPDAIRVQLCAEPREGEETDIHPMIRGEAVSDPAPGYSYSARIPVRRPAGDYTPRIIPALEGALVPIEANLILWYR